MTMAEFLVGELDHEAANTRRVLERVPEAHVAWRPHPKSYTMGDLALHLANLPVWMGISLRNAEFDIDPEGGRQIPKRVWESRESLLAAFDRNLAEARAILKETSDAELMNTWTLKKRGAAVFTLPKVAVVRSFVFNHMIHHRGQLTVYLRLKDVPLPGIYGPTADEA
jgi:uncharacterized damage-inducible protein DinB